MSCDNKPVVKDDSPTLWEHFVMHKASEKKLMLFDLEIDDEKTINANQKKRKMSALDAATAIAMKERNRSFSAPPYITATTTNVADPASSSPLLEIKVKAKAEPELPQSPLDPVSSLAKSHSSHHTTSFDSVTLDSPHEINFGPAQLHALAPEILRKEAERQTALIKPCPTKGLTMKRRLELDQQEELLMMSGALDVDDGRCEVCAARERAMGGLEEAGIVAL